MKTLVFLLLSLPLLAFADGGLPNQPYIYVEGNAEIEKPADMVTLSFQVVTHNPDQGKANQEAQAKAGKIFTLLNNSKIAEKDVIAGDLSSEAEYEEDDNSPRRHGKFIGYTVTRAFSVKVRDIFAFPKLVDQLLATGQLEFSGIHAGLSDERELKDQVWDKAISDARERAEKTLKAAGMKIDSIFVISPIGIPEIHQRILGYETGPEASFSAPSKISSPSQYRLAPITLSQEVRVIYLISPGVK